jgi:hypothetical protein
MKRRLAALFAFGVITVAVGVITATALGAQTAPTGWKQRIDASTDASDPDPAGDVKFTVQDGGFHTVNPKAAIFWNAASTASGTYTLKATFAQNARSSHPNYIGLIFGGKDLSGPTQSYTYFLVAPQGGTFLIKQRAGEQIKDIQARTPHDVITKLSADGKAANTLEVRVGTDKIDYVVNGTVVHSTPKAGIVTDGLYGMRVNHALPDVLITGLAVSK